MYWPPHPRDESPDAAGFLWGNREHVVLSWPRLSLMPSVLTSAGGSVSSPRNRLLGARSVKMAAWRYRNKLAYKMAVKGGHPGASRQW